jgi:hypothetical protein
VTHTRGTFAALVDAVVPETPALKERGEEHVPGGLAVGLDETLVEALNNLQAAADETPFARAGYETVPYSPVIATLLDIAALELLVQRNNEESISDPDEAFADGPFSRLARRDRLRAVERLKSDGFIARLDDRFHDRIPHLGVVKYLTHGLIMLIGQAYYSEWTDDNYPPLSWKQTDYPGPADGYAALLGYELTEFEEDDY